MGSTPGTSDNQLAQVQLEGLTWSTIPCVALPADATDAACRRQSMLTITQGEQGSQTPAEEASKQACSLTSKRTDVSMRTGSSHRPQRLIQPCCSSRRLHLWAAVLGGCPT